MIVSVEFFRFYVYGLGVCVCCCVGFACFMFIIRFGPFWVIVVGIVKFSALISLFINFPMYMTKYLRFKLSNFKKDSMMI